MASDNILLDPDRLVRLWVAEGFIAPKKGKTLEEVGLGYLKELISRGLVQALKDGRGGGIKFVAVHSLLHAFAESEAQESGLFEMHHHAHILNPHSARRLALHNYVDSYVDIPDHFPKLRSLFCDFFEEDQQQGGSGGEHQHGWAEWFLRACGSSSSESPATRLHGLSFIRASRFLRVIHLYGMLLARVPNEMGDMIHLRYLGIRNCKLEALPSSISKLDNLQTLDVRRTGVQHVTDEFWEIQGLRHVLADGLRLTSCPGVRLRHLQTLVGAVPTGHTWGARSCPLDSMVYLRSLAMSLVCERHMPALSQALQKMELLVSLSLSGDLLPSGVFTSRCSRRLEVMVLDGRLEANLGDDPFFLPSLGMLSLRRLAVKQDFIDKVATLPNLTEMELLDDSYSGVHLVFPAEGFQSLTRLKLLNLAQLELALVPNSTVFTRCGCPVLKVEHPQQVAAHDPADEQMLVRRELYTSYKNEMFSGHQEPEFEDELQYIHQEIEEVAVGDATEDQMLVRHGMHVRRGTEGLDDMEHLHGFAAGDPAEDEMLVRRGMEGLEDMEQFHGFAAGDPAEDEMIIRCGMESFEDMEHLHGFTAGDPADDEMLVRWGREGLERTRKTKHLQQIDLHDPAED
jgi:hypothetical protein